MPSPDQRPLPARLFTAQARLIARRPLLVIGLSLALTAGAGLLAATRLGFQLSRLQLLDPGLDYIKRYQALEQEFGDLDAVVVAVDSPEQAATRDFARALAGEIEADTGHFRSVFYRLDPASLGGQGLMLASDAQLQQLQELVRRARPALEGHSALAGVLSVFSAELRHVGEVGEDDAQAGAAVGHLAHDLLAGTLQALQGRAPPRTPLAGLAPFADEGYTWADDGRTLLMLVQARDTDEGMDPKSGAVQRLRALIAGMGQAHPGVRARLTGKPVLQVDEMDTYTADSLRASLAAFLGVTVLLVIALRRLLAPLLVGLCVLAAVVLTLGGATIWPGHLNLLAVVFVVIVIGLGVDFGIHLVTRYDEELHEGLEQEEALAAALRSTGASVAAGAATTVVAFLACLFTAFRGLREFGGIAALGVACSLLIMTTLLPALVLLLDRGRYRVQPLPRPRLLAALDRFNHERPGWVLAGVGLLVALAAVWARDLRYERSLLALQDPSLESVQLELELLRDRHLTSWFLALPSDDPAELARIGSKLAALDVVDRTEGLRDVLPAPAVQGARLPRLREIQAALGAALAERPPVSAAELEPALVELEDALSGLQEQALAGGRRDAVEGLETLLQLVMQAEDALGAGLGQAVAWDQALERDLRALLTPLYDPQPRVLRPADLPLALRERLVGAHGQSLLRIYPSGNMWDYTQLDAFVDQVSQVEPRVTGVPVLVRESTRLMVEGYQAAGAYAAIAVTLCLLVFFRSLRSTALALASLVVGGVWMLALVVLVGSNLNPANLVALPLLLGIGVDSAVHVIHRGREGEGHELLAGSLGRGLLYSTLTSVAGFGSLLLARHVGTASIGSSISLGVLACLAAAVTLPPAFLALGRRRRGGG